MKVTLKVIAEEAGVSQMTVSRILRGKADGQVSDQVRKKVVAALEKHGYDFQKPERQIRQTSGQVSPVIHVILPYADYLERPPEGQNLQLFDELRDHADRSNVKLNYVVGLNDNNPAELAWNNLSVIKPGEPVLFYSTYEIPVAIALQKRGCRVAMILRDLFWRNYYAPQLKTMAQFVIRTAEGTAQAIRYLMDSGCQKIACAVYARHIDEPGYPVLSGYDYVLRLRNGSYRHVIPISRPDNCSDLPQRLSEAYERDPFDALFLPSFSLPNISSDETGSLQHYFGLPESVRIAVANPGNDIELTGAGVVLQFPYRELLPDVFDTLLAKVFRPVEKFYDCRLQTTRSCRKSVSDRKHKTSKPGGE